MNGAAMLHCDESRDIPGTMPELAWRPGAVRRCCSVTLTGWGQEDDRRRAREAGFDHHLVKPAEAGALRSLLAALPGA